MQRALHRDEGRVVGSKQVMVLPGVRLACAFVAQPLDPIGWAGACRRGQSLSIGIVATSQRGVELRAFGANNRAVLRMYKVSFSDQRYGGLSFRKGPQRQGGACPARAEGEFESCPQDSFVLAAAGSQRCVQ